MFNNEIVFDIARTTRHVLYDETRRYCLLMCPANTKATAFRFSWKDTHTKKVVARGYLEGSDTETLEVAWTLLKTYKEGIKHLLKIDEAIYKAVFEGIEEGDLDLSALNFSTKETRLFWETVRGAKKAIEGIPKSSSQMPLSSYFLALTFLFAGLAIFFEETPSYEKWKWISIVLMTLFSAATLVTFWKEQKRQ